MVTLKKAGSADIQEIWQMQRQAFAGLLEKYQDYDTNPGAEGIDRIRYRFEQAGSVYYFIMEDGVKTGVIRIVDRQDGSRKRISPLWIMPACRGRGLAQAAIWEAERLYGPDHWSLDTILQEEGNLHLYEKMGYHQTGEVRHVNDKMDIVFYEKDVVTTVYFVRHAEPVHKDPDDRNRPLTAQGLADTALVLETLKDKPIDVFYCSPYKRSRQTIQSTADFFRQEIHTDERLRERQAGDEGNVKDLFRKRWADFHFHEPGGESIGAVQKRNIEALTEILQKEAGKTIVIGTHGTALSSILNYYDPSFDCESFLRIIDWMPYIVEMQFVNQERINMKEIAHLVKPFEE